MLKARIRVEKFPRRLKGWEMPTLALRISPCAFSHVNPVIDSL